MPRSSLSSADINPMARGSVVSGVTIIHKDNRLFSNNNSTNDEDINKDNSRSDSSYSSVQMGSNILKEEIISLKLEITHKDKGIKQKDSQIYKLQTEVSTQKKELAASRAYAIKLENDIRDLEHSLLIQKQKQSSSVNADFNRQSPFSDNSNKSESENLKSWFLEQRMRQMELEICKQDNKISNLSDKLLDLRFDNNNQSTRSRQRQNRGRQNNANKYSRNERSQFDRHSENKHCKFQNDFADFSGGMSFRHDESQPNSLHIDTSGSENETNSVVNGQTNNSDNFLGNIHSRGKSKCQTQARKRFHEKSEQIYIPPKKANETSTAEVPTSSTGKVGLHTERQFNDAHNGSIHKNVGKDIHVQEPHDNEISIDSVLNILSFNIEGFLSNNMYLSMLEKRADIIMLQEHWLHNREKQALEEFLTDFLCLVKCFDDDKTNDPTERRRGHAGVAICVNKKLQNLVELLPDGCNRVIAIRLNVKQPLVLICVYMPTRGGNITIEDFKTVLDELSEMIEKYLPTSDIIIGGDMNASLHRNERKIPRDTVFDEFLKSNGLSIPSTCKKQSTFFHFNNRDESQIDYFVETSAMVKKYLSFNREFQNLSTHDPIMISINCCIERMDISTSDPRPLRIKWDKIDKQKYENLLQERLTEFSDVAVVETAENIENILTKFSDIIVTTAESLCPKRKNNLREKGIGPQK
ncbi:unnamed protein product [Mytilus edulis]|uniref:Endonuclease/exonuclease/phosphatase domain-containing protein n=1 Tax=Mytilus edulis TaxID=6550 RepID=A0A8S3TU79_MYTED|nr:unnamed protein product [Mytilus edulis]